jgi:pSer/pThr/pTyr-binding forkhead associated (FHA) protein
VRGSNRHIALPVTCQLVLGRFDPGLSDLPDIDLTYEDQRFLTVSRRHAKIIGANGRFTVKDLGSSNGVFLNDEPVTLGFSRQFEPGDIVRLGYLQLRYDLMPTELLDPAKAAQFQHFLLVAFTGRRQLIAPPDHVLIGRVGSQVNLSQAGDAAERVSDRHALITWHNNSPYLEDLGSSQGTRLNGEPVLAGQSIPLRPGDHIWLGGCVLAYDVRRQATGLNQPPGQSN